MEIGTYETRSRMKTPTGIGNGVRQIRAWSERLPYRGEDLREALNLQYLCLVIAAVLIAPSLFATLSTGAEPVNAQALVFVLLCLAVAVLVRLGHWRFARVLFVVAVTVAMAVPILAFGLVASQILVRQVVIVLIVAGIALGRRGLWALCGTVLLVLFLAYGRSRWTNSMGAESIVQPAGGPLFAATSWLVVAVFAVDRFVVELKRALSRALGREAELLRANAQLKEEMDKRLELEAALSRTQRLELIGRLSGGIAHDFNNILGVIQGFSDLAEERPDNPEIVRAALSNIGEATKRASGLTQQLLAIGRRQMVKAQLVCLTDTSKRSCRCFSIWRGGPFASRS